MEFRLVISLEKDLEHPFWDEKINFISNESPSVTLPKGLSSLLPEYFHKKLRILLEDPKTQECFVSSFNIDRLDPQTLWIHIPKTKMTRRLEEFLCEIIKKSQLGY